MAKEPDPKTPGRDEAKTSAAPKPAEVQPTDPKQMTEEVTPEPVVTIQDQGIGPNDPYPTGSPPDQEEAYTRVHGGTRPPDEDVPNTGAQKTKKE